MFEVGRVSAVRAAITRAQKWPGIAQPALWARTAGSSFVFGGVLVALITALTPTPSDHAVLQYANATAAMAIIARNLKTVSISCFPDGPEAGPLVLQKNRVILARR